MARKAKDAASTPSTNKILYGVEECPPWYLCALLGLQVGSVKRVNSSQNTLVALFTYLVRVSISWNLYH